MHWTRAGSTSLALSLALPALAAAPLAPRADHHLHLISAATAVTQVPPLLPEVAVDPEIARLLEQRIALIGDLPKFSQLYVSPPTILHPLYPIWLRGEEALETANSTPRNARLVPQVYSASPAAAFIGGIWVRASDPARPITNFFVYAVKGADNRWRIAAEGLTAKKPPLPTPVDAARIIGELDAAGIAHGMVLSLAYQVGADADRPEAPGDRAAVRLENDWVAAQVGLNPGRLVGACGINPLRSYAIAEIRRCATLPGMRAIKLHFGASAVNLRRPSDLARVAAAFAAADRAGLAIVVHAMTRERDYGAADTALFLAKLLPRAPHVAVQIAHLAGAGPGFDGKDALAGFAAAAQARDPRMANVYFDVASVVTANSSPAERELVAQSIRELGPAHILFGSDRSASNDPPKAAWEAFRALPLSDEEFATIASNEAPYLSASGAILERR